MLKDLKALCRQLGIDSKINSDGRVQQIHHNERFKLNILKSNECIKLAFHIYPYLIHPEKKENIRKIFRDKEILNSIRIDNCKSLLREFTKKSNLRRKDLSEYFSRKLNYQTANSTINGRLSGIYRPPLSIVLHCCDVLEKDYFEYIPREYSFILS
jgi:hypothetical protein